MKKIIKRILIKVIYYSGLPFITREIIKRRKVTIITLHDPAPAAASKQLLWLSRHYNIISLDHFLALCEKKNDQKLPAKSLVITLDDGHIGNYELLPLVKELNIPVTIFLCSGIINTNRHYWFKTSGLQQSSDSMKTISNKLRLKGLAELGFQPEKEFSYPQALTKKQILEMKEYVNFQCHTVSHPVLTQCNDEESWQEIHESKRQLESEYGLAINAIAYPNGDYSEREIEFVKKAGYKSGLTVGENFTTIKTDLFAVKRFSVSDTDSPELVAIKASGIWALLKYKIWRRIISR
jgi:peptidoglycan/xylan/chitin deacetylase (PgdA/CDA1 family)